MTFIVRQIAQRSAGGEIVRRHEVTEDEIGIGRSAENAIHLSDLAVDPMHARVVRTGPQEVTITSVRGQPFDLDGRSVTSAVIDAVRGGELRFGSHLITVGVDNESGHTSFSVRRVEALSDVAEEKD